MSQQGSSKADATISQAGSPNMPVELDEEDKELEQREKSHEGLPQQNVAKQSEEEAAVGDGHVLEPTKETPCRISPDCCMRRRSQRRSRVRYHKQRTRNTNDEAGGCTKNTRTVPEEEPRGKSTQGQVEQVRDGEYQVNPCKTSESGHGQEASEGADGEPSGQTELSDTDTTDASVTSVHVYLHQSLHLPPRHCALVHVRIDGSPPTPNLILLESDETTEHETTNDTDVPQSEQIPVVELTPGHEVIRSNCSTE